MYQMVYGTSEDKHNWLLKGCIVRRAKKAREEQGEAVSDHFVRSSQMVSLGKCLLINAHVV
jgi:hypothetical protein